MQLVHSGLPFQVLLFSEEVASVSIIATDGHPWLLVYRLGWISTFVTPLQQQTCLTPGRGEFPLAYLNDHLEMTIGKISQFERDLKSISISHRLGQIEIVGVWGIPFWEMVKGIISVLSEYIACSRPSITGGNWSLLDDHHMLCFFAHLYLCILLLVQFDFQIMEERHLQFSSFKTKENENLLLFAFQRKLLHMTDLSA